MTQLLLRRLTRMLLAAIYLALVLCGPVRAEGQTKPLPDPSLDAAMPKAAGQQTAVFAAGSSYSSTSESSKAVSCTSSSPVKVRAGGPRPDNKKAAA